ncbi:MAG: endolytic transglycosylase MltG [Lachnospiraceae bacterium]|nr:endolytic transglycosylase MltG [Lachnospiraceae bacterium]
MKFKYMIRGLGLGVIITAAVLGAYNRNAVADARVAVLKDYGLDGESPLEEETSTAEEASAAESTEPVIMRDDEKEAEIESVLDAAKDAENSDNGASDGEGLNGDAANGEILDGELSNGEPSNEEPSNGNISDSQASDAAPSGQETPEQGSSAVVVVPSDEEEASGETVEIVIESGDDSGTVSRKLQNAGVIENASEFDAFLMQHGYDKKISTGKKVIGVADTWQEIADKISRSS